MTVQRFALAGLVSGVVSAVTMAIPWAFCLVPPVAIGIALAMARRSSVRICGLFVVASTLAWFATLIIGAACTRLEDVPPAGIWPVLLASITGAVLFVAAYCLVFRPYAGEVLFVFVTPIAALLALIGFGVMRITNTVWEEPESSLYGFRTLLMIWQTGVAVAIGWSERMPSYVSNKDDGWEQTKLDEAVTKN